MTQTGVSYAHNILTYTLPPQAAPDTAEGQFQSVLNGDRIKGIVPYAAAAIASFVKRQMDQGFPWQAKPPGSVFSIIPALQSTDYIHMVRDIAMKPALSYESSRGSTPNTIARDFPPSPQQVSVFPLEIRGWQAGTPNFNYGYLDYGSWLTQHLGGLPSLSGQAPPQAAGPMAGGAG